MDVYRNLNKPGLTFSLRERGRVTGYLTAPVILTGVRMKHASPKQQTACRARRQVCQWLKADTVTAGEPDSLDGFRRLLCDPKRVDGFCDAETGERVDNASQVILTTSGAYYR